MRIAIFAVALISLSVSTASPMLRSLLGRRLPGMSTGSSLFSQSSVFSVPKNYLTTSPLGKPSLELRGSCNIPSYPTVFSSSSKPSNVGASNSVKNGDSALKSCGNLSSTSGQSDKGSSSSSQSDNSCSKKTILKALLGLAAAYGVYELFTNKELQLLRELMKKYPSDEAVYRLLSGIDDNKKVNVNHKYFWGTTPLLFLTKKLVAAGRDSFVANRLDVIIERIISSGASVNVTDFSGRTPLHYAAIYSARNEYYNNRDFVWNLDTLTLLLIKGANINAQDPKGRTAIMHALIERRKFNWYSEIDYGKGFFVQDLILFLEYKPNLDIQDKFGNTALHYAAMYAKKFGKDDAYKLLIKAGAKEDLVNINGETPKKLLGNSLIFLPE